MPEPAAEPGLETPPQQPVDTRASRFQAALESVRTAVAPQQPTEDPPAPQEPPEEPEQQTSGPGEPKDPEPEPESEPGKLSPELRRSWAMMSKRDAELQERERQVKSQLEQAKPLTEAAAMFSKDPVAALQALAKAAGYSGNAYSYITEAMLKDGSPGGQKPDESPLAKEVEDLKAQIKQREEAEQRAQQEAQAEQYRTEYRNEIQQFTEANGEKFPLLASLGRTDLVFQRAVNYAQATKMAPPPIEQLAQEVEGHLNEEISNLVPKLLNVPSVKDRLLSELGVQKPEPPAEPPREPEVPRPKESGRPQTLTNRNVGGAPPRDGRVGTTAAERRAQARAIYEKYAQR